MLSHVQLFVTPWAEPTSLLCPWNSPDKNTRLSRHSIGQSFPSPGDLPDPGIKHMSHTLQTESLPSEPSGKPTLCLCVCAESLCSPMDCSPPGSSVHGILQARILEWIAMPSSRASSQPRDSTHVSYISCIGRHFCIFSTTIAAWEAPYFVYSVFLFQL